MPRKGDVVLVKREVDPRGEALEDPLPDSKRIHAMLVLTVCACFGVGLIAVSGRCR